MGKALGAIAVVIGLALAILTGIAFVFSIAWNAVVPSTFGGPELTFGASFALIIVISIIGSLLFGGVRRG
jgi:hypothetical protein